MLRAVVALAVAAVIVCGVLGGVVVAWHSAPPNDKLAVAQALDIKLRGSFREVRFSERIAVVRASPDVDMMRAIRGVGKQLLIKLAWTSAKHRLLRTDGGGSIFHSNFRSWERKVGWDWLGPDNEISVSVYRISRSLTAVRPLNLHFGVGFARFPYKFVKAQIGSELSLRAFPILLQVLEQGDERSAREKSLQHNSTKHPVGKDRHGLLRREIALLTLLGVAGLRLGYRALREAVDAPNIFQTIAWAIGWIGLTAVGGYCIVMVLIWSIN